MLEYQIVTKEAFTLMGKQRAFSGDTGYQEVPRFWREHMASPDSRTLLGAFGLCVNREDGTFDYLIADLYQPQKEIPQGWAVKTLPAGTWAVFPCRGPLPQALQQVNTRIWSEWFPAHSDYRPAGGYDLEVYFPPKAGGEMDYSEIWIPVEPA